MRSRAVPQTRRPIPILVIPPPEHCLMRFEAGAIRNFRSNIVMTMPPPLFDRLLLRRRRLRSLGSGPQFLNHIVTAELAERLSIINRPLQTMLVHGAASTLLTAKAQDLRPAAKIIATDIVERPDIDLVFDDEALPLAPHSLDAFIHVLGLESTNDVPGVLAQISRALKPDGVFLAAVLGGDTLSELRQAWLSAEIEVLGGTTPRVAPFVHIREWGALLQRAGFALPVVDSDRRIARYRDIVALMRDLRGLGLANPMTERSRKPLSRRLLASLAQAYANLCAPADGRIPATFEILYLTAWSPHPNQQKPLSPGSASLRLAEALGVEERKLKRD
jgi:NADH dehydrogenase [ubiquinone] 1 alpha subcomplex assembly factor 5